MTLLAANANAGLDAMLSGTIYCGLLVSGTEVVGGAYIRQAVAWGAAILSQKQNSSAVNFPAATTAWGTVDGFALYTAALGGSVIDSFPSGLTPPVVADIGIMVVLPAGTITMTIT